MMWKNGEGLLGCAARPNARGSHGLMERARNAVGRAGCAARSSMARMHAKAACRSGQGTTEYAILVGVQVHRR